ncbi:hypothetical protein KSP40_PGU001688 [Platanthera guangdongensis]|uniref:PUM-HD domain-containing protein n=1 Tax=Platanthera guangdongensis TaxID=2320717 RepID=A0ABR2LZI0_9ASPA
MVTEGSVQMPPVNQVGNLEEDYGRDIEAVLREHQQQQSGASFDLERELNICRSGSAPPSVEGSRNAMRMLLSRAEVRRFDDQNAGDVLTEEEIRSHPSYMSYYYLNENLNPRLPPPFLSKEDWRVAQRLDFGGPSFGGIGDCRSRKQWDEGDGISLFSAQPALLESGENEQGEHIGVGEWLNGTSDGLIGLTDMGLGARRKSFANALQDDFNFSTAVSDFIPPPTSQNAFENTCNSLNSLSDFQQTQPCNDIEAVDTFCSRRTPPGLVRVQSMGSTLSQSFASALDPSLSRSRTPGPQLIGRSSSPSLHCVGSRVFDVDTKMLSNGFGGVSSEMTDYGDMEAALAGLSLSNTRGRQNIGQHQAESDFLIPSSTTRLTFNGFSKISSITKDNISQLGSDEQISPLGRLSTTNLPKKVAAVGTSNFAGPSIHYQKVAGNVDFPERNPNAYFIKHGRTSMLNNQLDTGTVLTGGLEYVCSPRSEPGSDFQGPPLDPLYAHYLQRACNPNSPNSGNLNDLFVGKSFLGSSHMDLPWYQNAYLEQFIAQQRLQYGGSLNNGSGLNNGLYGSDAFGAGMPYPLNPVSGTSLSSMGSGNSLRQNGRLPGFPSVLRSAMAASKGSWNHQNSSIEGFTSTLLEEFKSNKTRSFELSDIVDHVVEFSADQYGSRFIQQKLETATVEEKNQIFPELLPHIHTLMTDVFGNYVIQKFFEHGTDSQRNQLGSQLLGHVLTLSLQMYGCRVIQKALEVVDMEKQAQMVSELDGSVMKCVRDQNGNHVIQKCIECVPQERIKFIISACYGQVVALSTHPYGCRVIQRILEHCDDAKTQCIMMDEILKSICTLAKDQYGNYVVQHVLQHGKPEERSSIISMLSGQIVKMSQQKFASNVIEKCLTYSSLKERQLLINEMLGSTEENEPLQAMMKDQFANYVVQKVLETCDDRNREIILSRIKVHLNTLKRYTYGKHIVARVEKLIAAGERRIGLS